jgi:hypothetical protein
MSRRRGTSNTGDYRRPESVDTDHRQNVVVVTLCTATIDVVEDTDSGNFQNFHFFLENKRDFAPYFQPL